MSRLVPGIYEQLVTDALARELEAQQEKLRLVLEPLDDGDSDEILSRHVAEVLRRALRALPEEGKLERQLALCNAVLEDIGRRGSSAAADPAHGRALVSVREPLAPEPLRPTIPLSTSALLVNGRSEPAVGSELAKELESADSVDLICAFVQWNGVRILEEPLKRLQERGARLRVITTTYMGATQRRALDYLAELGAEIRIAYERPPARTRLHAKAWLFHRDSGFSTAFVGSSNLSHSALLDGLEWNVRLSRVDAPAILEKFRATFDSYWEDEDFEPYDPATDGEKFDRAVQAGQPGALLSFVGVDVHPLPHQREILERLTAERERHERFRSLVVAATGTGKTVIAALDYRRLRQKHGDLSLLFVAHRKEILLQSRATFRTALRDGAFGELFVDGLRPSNWRHVFASIQSLSQLGEAFAPDRFDVVVIDEFHHAAAPTYQALLERLRPRYLLGLTATPERADGQRVDAWFGGRIAAELRLWDALDRNLLAPFHYFGVHDDVKLAGLKWERGGYLARELENVYTGNHARVGKVLQAIKDKVADPLRMRAIGFCVGVEHAEFMAEQFTKAGIAARAVLGATESAERANAIEDLRNLRVNVLFAVDVFNEGVDIPEIDTVLFLRPTESVTVFLQQLGRGLRLAEGKSCLTVLDFIGQQNREFRFDLRLRALTGRKRSELAADVQHGFPFLPPGCHLELDRVAREIVLENVKQALRVDARGLASELRRLGDVSLREFLRETGVELGDVYRNGRTWSSLRRLANLPVPPEGSDEKVLGRAIGRLLHLDDAERLAAYRRMLAGDTPGIWAGLREERLVRMLLLQLFAEADVIRDFAGCWRRLWENPSILAELRELFAYLDEEAAVLPKPLGVVDVPLWVHCRYSRNEILGAFGYDRPSNMRQGVMFDRETGCDLFFVTLRKTDREYSPSTLYRDFPISPELFHWESQSETTQASATGQRYIHHQQFGTKVLLFVREAKKDAAGNTMPYVFLGPARYVRHEGERPMAITWRLERPMPAQYFLEAKAAAG